MDVHLHFTDPPLENMLALKVLLLSQLVLSCSASFISLRELDSQTFSMLINGTVLLLNLKSIVANDGDKSLEMLPNVPLPLPLLRMLLEHPRK